VRTTITRGRRAVMSVGRMRLYVHCPSFHTLKGISRFFGSTSSPFLDGLLVRIDHRRLIAAHVDTKSPELALMYIRWLPSDTGVRRSRRTW
jgi:hypothetical protein